MFGLGDVGWHKTGGTYDFYKNNDMENGYASIRVITECFAAIEPYTIDVNGQVINSNVTDKLYTPNKQLSAFDFREALSVMSLVHNKVRIRVHFRGEQRKADSILGFTIMENYAEKIVDGKYIYTLSDSTNLTDDEVITLKNINPYNLDAGFSPAYASRRWTSLDDLIADYQRGFFENGAIPAGQFIITARTKTEYNDIKQILQAKHRGADKNNNVVYSHRPTDENGSPLNARIEWQPFSVVNKDLSMKDLFEQANKKIDSVYGVPASLRGVNDTNTYASVRVDEVLFLKYRMNPFIMKIWNKFTHELNRITGGFGASITYDLEIPEIADESLVKAQSKQVHVNLINMLSEKYELDAIIDAFELPATYKLLIEKPTEETDPVVVDTSELDKLPDQPIEKKLTEGDRTVFEAKLDQVISKQMKKQVDKAVGDIETKQIGDGDDESFVKDLFKILAPLVAIYGQKTVDIGVSLILKAGLNTDGITAYKLNPEQAKEYTQYIKGVAQSYNEQTAEQIRTILDNRLATGATKNEVEKELRTVILGDDNKYRIKRFSKTEINYCEGKGSITAMQNIQAQTGYKIYKVWNTSGANPCEFCQALSGQKNLVDEKFIDQHEHVHGVDGGEFITDFKDIESAELHPNCNCYATFEVEA